MRVVIWRANRTRVRIRKGHGGGAYDKGSADLGELDALAELIGRSHGVRREDDGEGASVGCGDETDDAESKKFEMELGWLWVLKDAASLSLVDRYWTFGGPWWAAIPHCTYR